MGGLIQPSPLTEKQRDSNLLPILLGVALVVVVVGVIALLTRGSPKSATAPHPYAANLKLADLKMSAAENFVGASVTYIDGNVTNSGDKTVTHAIVHVAFRNSLGEVAQAEDVALCTFCRPADPTPMLSTSTCHRSLRARASRSVSPSSTSAATGIRPIPTCK